MKDPHPKMLADMDQAIELMKRAMVPAITGYFHELVKNGLKREEALALTINYQSLLLQFAKQSQRGDQ